MRDGSWFRSGDTVYRDPHGNYFFCGRDDDMLKVGGIWVAPFEVEPAVVGQPADAGLVKPKAVVVLRDKTTVGPTLEGALREFVKARLAPSSMRAGSSSSTSCRRRRAARSSASGSARPAEALAQGPLRPAHRRQW